MAGNIIKIYQVSGQLEGELLKAYLEANGVPAALSQESAGIVYGLTIGALGNVDVLISDENVERATLLIEEYQKGQIDKDKFE